MSEERERTWVESHLGRELTDFQRKCVELLCYAMGTAPYNIQCNWNKVNWISGDYGCIFVVSHTTFSTFDFAELTRLVIGAHDQCIRISIRPCAPNRMRIMMHKRTRAGQMSARHPTIEEAIERWRPKEKVAA